MDAQETIENDALAALFQEALIQELNSRGVHFTEATAQNFANVNIDSYIYIEDYPGRYLFTYTGISWLRGRKLSEMTLEEYIRGHVEWQLKDLKSEIESDLKNLPRQIENPNTSDGYRRELEKRLGSARKIASWLVRP